jgi:hypothetical protein
MVFAADQDILESTAQVMDPKLVVQTLPVELMDLKMFLQMERIINFLLSALILEINNLVELVMMYLISI